MKFKIINSDQGHNYTHYVDAPDRETAMKRFKAGHYGSIVDCEEVAEDKKAPVIRQESNPNANAIHVKREIELEELPKPIGDYIFENAVGKHLPDGTYYHYSQVCLLLKSYSRERVEAMEKQLSFVNKVAKEQIEKVESLESKLSTLEETLKAADEVIECTIDPNRIGTPARLALEKYNSLKLKTP